MARGIVLSARTTPNLYTEITTIPQSRFETVFAFTAMQLLDCSRNSRRGLKLPLTTLISGTELIEKLPEESWFRDWHSAFPTAEMPVSYVLLAAMSVYGACLGRATWFNDDFRQIFPMLNLLMIGPSGIGKSSSMEIARKFLLEKLPAELRPQFIGGASTKEQLHADLLPLPHAILFASELASFFNKAKYMEPLVPYVCLTPDVPVLTADLRWKPVGELKVGEELIGFDEQTPKRSNGRHLHKAVVEATGRISAPCYRLSTDRGDITCSEEHAFLVFRNGLDTWITAKKLKLGDEVRWFGTPWKDDESREGAWLSGLLDGEGCVSKWRVSFNQNQGAVLDKAVSILEEKDYSIGVYPRGKAGRCKVVTIAGLYDRLRLLGTIRPVRLLDSSEKTWEGRRFTGIPAQTAKLTGIEFLGDKEVVPLQTSTKTIISGGFYTHNTELLDYRPIEFRTKSGGIQRIPEPSVTVIGGSTKDWLQSALPDTAVGGGFLPRFLIVKEDFRRQRVANAQMSMSASKWRDLLKRREAVFEDFIHLVATPRGPIGFEDFATADYYARWYEAHEPATGHLSPFSARAAEMVKRLSMLVALSSRRDAITEADLDSAIVIYQYCIQKLQEVVIPTTPIGKLLSFVLDSIPSGGATAMEVRQGLRTQAPAQDVDKYLQSLILSGDVEFVEGKYRRISD